MHQLKQLAKNFAWLFLKLIHGASSVPLRVRGGPAKGAVLNLDLRSEASYWIGNYDDYAFSRLRFERYLRPGDVAWDCGAFVGYYAAVFRKLVGERGRVVVFEASSRNYATLAKLPGLNRWTNVEIRFAAVGPEHTDLKFVTNRGGASGPFALSKNYDSPATLSVETVRCFGVDELVFAEGVPIPAFMKFDLESAEEFALHNGPRTFREGRPVILLELHGEPTRLAAARFLDTYGYGATPVQHLASIRTHSVQDWLQSLRQNAVRSGRELCDLAHMPHMLLTLPLEHPDWNDQTTA